MASKNDVDMPGMGEGWEPEPGSVLCGKIESVTGAFSKFLKGNYPIVTVVAEEGTKSEDVEIGDLVNVHCFHTVLFSRVMGLKPVHGEKVTITYYGKKAKKSDPTQETAVYTVTVEGRGEEDPYSQFSLGGPAE